MPRRKRARPKEKEDDARDLPRKRQHVEGDGETVVIVDSEEEEFRHREREKKTGMLGRDQTAQGPEMTEEEMFNLAMKLSEQEAKSATLQQQQEDEAIKKAIAESLHTNGIQPDNGTPELVALMMTPASPVPSDQESLSAPQSPVFPGRKKSLHLKQSNADLHPSNCKKRQQNSPVSQRSELCHFEPPRSSVFSLVSEKEKNFSQKNDSRSHSPHQETHGIYSCHLQSESNVFGPTRTSPADSPILCITKLSQDLVEDCQTTGYILCSQKLSGCLETSQMPRSSQPECHRLLESPKLPETLAFPRTDMDKGQKVTKSEGRGVSQDLCLESSDDSQSLLSRVKMLSLSRRQLLKEQTPGEKNLPEQVCVGLSQSEEEVCLKSMASNKKVRDSTREQKLLPVTSDSDDFPTKMELHWLDDDDDDDDKDLEMNNLTKLKTGLIRSHQGLHSTGTGRRLSSDLEQCSSPIFPREALCSMGPQGSVTAVECPTDTANSPGEVQQKSTVSPSDRTLTSTDHPAHLVEEQGHGAVHYYWGVPFCPRGLDPDDYTCAILAQLEVYEKSLKKARRGLLCKASWGDPVLPGPAEASRRGRPKQFHPPQRLPNEEDEVEEEDEDENEDKTTKVMEIMEGEKSTGSPRGSEASERKTGETQGDDPLMVPSPLVTQENTPLVKKLNFHENPRRLRKHGARDSSLMDKAILISEVQSEEEDTCQELNDENTQQLMQNPEKSKVHTAEPECREILEEQQEQSGPAETGSEQKLQQAEDAGTKETPGTPELVQCPICMHNFPLVQIEMHAAYCDGSPEDPPLEEPSAQVRTLRSSRRLEVLDEDQPNSSSSGNAQDKEKCCICQGMFVMSEYKQHVDDCLSRRTAATNKDAKKLLVALDQSEHKRSAGPSDSALGKRENSPIDELADSKEAQSTGFQVSSSPVRTFTPISEITDCCIDFKRQHISKPSQRRGCKKKFK